MGPFREEPMTDDLSIRIRESCTPGLMPTAGIRVYPSGCCMPKEFSGYAEQIRDFVVRPDDVWCISYPRTGTTWSLEMAWLLSNNLDYKTAKEKILRVRAPFFETGGLVCRGELWDQQFQDPLLLMDQLPSPRVIKTHLPVELLPTEIWTKKPKIIYVTREPKDVAVSYYHHHRLWFGYNGSYDDFMEAFLQDKLAYSPFWEHVAGYLRLAHLPNVLINSYEEMVTDLATIIQRTASFIGTDLTEKEILALVDHLSFKSMKENDAVSEKQALHVLKETYGLSKEDSELSFCRKGKEGAWKEVMSAELAERFDRWSAEKKQQLGIEKGMLSSRKC